MKNLDLKNKAVFSGQFGLERETLRVTENGRLSSLPHPFDGNNRLGRDFCENQLELITPVCGSITELMDSLCALDSYVRKSLSEHGEYLWMNSNPPRIRSAADIRIAQFCGRDSFKYDYRLKLEKRYGKRLMLYSGIHFNFSFAEELLMSVYSGDCSYRTFKDSLYFRLLKQVFRYSWLLVILTAASPVYDKSLDNDYDSGSAFDGFASNRNSRRGYWNKFIPIIDYTDLESYIASVNDYVSSGKLIAEGELYLPARLKPANGSSLSELAENGVDHIELRMFDVNPLANQGIFLEDMEFTHYFLIYLLQLPDFEFTAALQKSAVENHRAAAVYDLDRITINDYPARDAACGMLDDMSEYFKEFPQVLSSIARQKNKIVNNSRYCTGVYDRLIDDFQNNMLEIAKNRY